jgi:hypothetical protein
MPREIRIESLDVLKAMKEIKERESKVEIETAQFWTKVEGEGELVRTFAKIPEGYTGLTSDLPEDDEVFFWLTPKEWIGLGAGEVYGDVEVLSCACDECEFFERGR